MIGTLEKIEVSHKSLSLAQKDSSILTQMPIILGKQVGFCGPWTSALICLPELTARLYRQVWRMSISCQK